MERLEKMYISAKVKFYKSIKIISKTCLEIF